MTKKHVTGDSPTTALVPVNWENIDTSLDGAVREQLQNYLMALRRENRNQNLVGTDSPLRIWHELILDAVFAWQMVPRDVTSILDVGSGAGFPGIVWAVLAGSQGNSEVSLELIEPRNLRVDFLRDVAEELNLQKVAIYKRKLSAQRTKCDLVTSRAVFSDGSVAQELAPWAERYVLLHAPASHMPEGWEVVKSFAYKGTQHTRYLTLLQRVLQQRQ